MGSDGQVRDMRSDAVRNRDVLVRAAITAVHREGIRVPMATIASDAGVGIGTLYRHFPTREDLLSHLTHISFEQIFANAQTADRDGSCAIESLRLFVLAAMRQRNDLVLPLHGGPPVVDRATATLRRQVHRILQRIIDRGRADGTILADVRPQDVAVFGSMLSQPRPVDPNWEAMCRRLLENYLAGLHAGEPSAAE